MLEEDDDDNNNNKLTSDDSAHACMRESVVQQSRLLLDLDVLESIGSGGIDSIVGDHAS